MSTFATIDRAEFARRLLAATANTAFRGAPPFKLGVEHVSGGTKMALDDGAAKVRTFFNADLDPQHSDARGWFMDTESALDAITVLLDLLAISLWRNIADGETLDARDTVFLTHWTEFRSPCGSRVSADEAQRLFGDAPTVTERDSEGVGIELAIEWEGPERLLGDDSEYAHRKANAQAAFGSAVSDAEERFIAACVAAFFAAMDRTRKH